MNNNISKKKLLLLSLLSGILMALSWVNVMSLGFLMLIAFIPLLFVEDYIAHNNSDKRFYSTATFIYSYPAFFLFTLPNTWWISNASFVGYIVPVLEATLMSVIFWLYSYSKNVAKQKAGAYFFLVFYWITLEFLQFTWDINFPWLNLGNSFATYPILVQWYSVLGMEGGTLWILLSNILIYLTIKPYLYNKKSDKKSLLTKEFSNQSNKLNQYKYLIFAILCIVIPIAWSIILWTTYKDDSTKTAKVLIVQPNLDPYNEQFVLPPEQVIARVENIAEDALEEKTDFLILPESCIQEYAWEDLLDRVPSIQELKRFTAKAKDCEIIAGMSSRKLLPQGTITNAARKINNMPNRYYESCNTALMFNKSSLQDDMQIRHKSILVAGVEKMPFTKYLPFIEKLALNLGGIVGTLGTDEQANVFESKNKKIKIGVPICWESIDGNYTRQFVKNGADFLQIITNVGWWGDTEGYKQYFAISRLRAIENRRYVSVCANTGLSGLVNAKGQIVGKGKFWHQQAFEYDVPMLQNQSFFALHGDMIMRPFAFFSILLLIYSIVRNRTEKKKV